MQYLCVLLEGMIAVSVSYCIVYFLCEKGKISLRRKGIWFQSKFVWAVTSVTFLAVCIISYLRLLRMPISLHILSLVLIMGMSVLAITDYSQHWVPNRMILVLLMIWTLVVGGTIILDTQYGMELLGRGLIGGIASGLIFLLCYILSKRQLGAGDVKLAFVMGLYMTGQRIMGGIVYGTLLCFFYSLIQLIRKRLTVKDQVPLVPFLYGGILITYFIL